MKIEYVKPANRLAAMSDEERRADADKLARQGRQELNRLSNECADYEEQQPYQELRERLPHPMRDRT